MGKTEIVVKNQKVIRWKQSEIFIVSATEA